MFLANIYNMNASIIYFQFRIIFCTTVLDMEAKNFGP